MLSNKRESTGLKYLNHFKAFIEYLNNMDDTYKKIEEYNPNEKQKILIVFDDTVADIVINKKLNPILKRLNISLVIITESYFAVPKNIRLNSTHYCSTQKRTSTSSI